MVYIGIDFSCNKTGICVLKNNIYSFYLFPLELEDKIVDKLKQVNINVINRERGELKSTLSSDKFRWNIYMSNNLSNLIINELQKVIDKDKVFIAFEGSSFSSKGDYALQLSSYRYILANELSKIYGLDNIFTYAPLTIKSIAGCASKDKKGKDSMINAFSNENINHKFNYILKNDPQFLKKKINFVEGIDDLVDSYFTLKTLINKNI